VLQQESLGWTEAQFAAPSRSKAEHPISMMAYRSRAVAAPTEGDLDSILCKAQQRNRAEGLTGLLIYDQGCYFQWLEGPAQALARVWESIRRDSRHRDIHVLRQESMPKRFFGAWDMRLARRARGKLDATLAVLAAPQDLLKHLRMQPSGLAYAAWDGIFADLVIPRLRGSLGPNESNQPHRAVVWHPHDGAAAQLAGLTLAVDQGAAAHYINDLVEQGADLETLYRDVFEPAARCLGGLADADSHQDLEISWGLARLQIEARRVGAAIASPLHAIRPGHAVLVAPQPGETDGLGAAISSELFLRDGWDVSCEYPRSDLGLDELLHEHWFDVLDLSLSSATRRDSRLPNMGATILSARGASKNPELTVIVQGRSVFERPRASLLVGADAGCASAVDSVSVALRLLDELAAAKTAVAGLVPQSRALGQAGNAAAASLRLFERRFRSTVF